MLLKSHRVLLLALLLGVLVCVPPSHAQQPPPTLPSGPTCEDRLQEWQEKGPAWIGAIMDGNALARKQQGELVKIQAQDAQHVKERDEAVEKLKKYESAAPSTPAKDSN
jgi:hypothetical protein